MAKRSDSDVNKSEKIREALRANPDKGPKDIAAMLQAQGLNVNAGYVSVVKGSMKRKGRRGGRRTARVVMGRGGRRPGRPKAVVPAANPLTAAIDLIRAAGSIEAAKQAIANIEEIRKLS